MAIVLTNSGKRILANRIKGIGTEPSWLAWGSGAGISSPADTDLFSESPEGRTLCVTSIQTTNMADDTYQAVGTLTATVPRSVTNAALFDSLNGGNIFIKGDFATVNLQANDSIQFTVKAVIS